MLGKPPPPASAPPKKLSTSVGSDDQRLNNLMARLAEGNDTKKITRQVAKQALDDADGHVGKAYGVLSRSAHAMGMNTLVGGGSRPHQPSSAELVQQYMKEKRGGAAWSASSRASMSTTSSPTSLTEQAFEAAQKAKDDAINRLRRVQREDDDDDDDDDDDGEDDKYKGGAAEPDFSGGLFSSLGTSWEATTTTSGWDTGFSSSNTAASSAFDSPTGDYAAAPSASSFGSEYAGDGGASYIPATTSSTPAFTYEQLLAELGTASSSVNSRAADAVSQSPPSLPYHERGAIRQALQELDAVPDATTNVKRRIVEDFLRDQPRLALSRLQAEAILRCFDCVCRRPHLVAGVLRARLERGAAVEQWADAFDGATTQEILYLCGGS